MKSRISNALVATAKEHQSYGEITESKVCIYFPVYGSFNKFFVHGDTVIDFGNLPFVPLCNVFCLVFSLEYNFALPDYLLMHVPCVHNILECFLLVD